MGEILEHRRKETAERVEKLRAELGDAEKLCADKACVYVTGSYGRREASRHSDLDLFIVGKGSPDDPALRGLDEILVKADLIDATRNLGIRDFSGEGEYLRHYTIKKLVSSLGTPEDDVENTFTARLLLLLESFPLVGESAYHQITEEVIAAYWKDYKGHKNDFKPAFLANDVIRMWRTFCVNYEARTRREPEKEMAKRRLKNYKLKHSRLLTCYSALMFLSATFSMKQTVGPADAKKMISLTPTERLEWMLGQPDLREAHGALHKLIEGYEEFLANTDFAEEEIVLRFMEKTERARYFESAARFSELVFEVLDIVGRLSAFHRLLVV
jgi:predicted nucleotidyltransferase